MKKKTHVLLKGGRHVKSQLKLSTMKDVFSATPYTSCADEKAWSQENFRLSFRQISTFGSHFEKVGTFGSLFEKLVTQS